MFALCCSLLLLFVFKEGSCVSQCPTTVDHLPGLNFTIQNTWNDLPSNNTAYNFTLQWFVEQGNCGVRCTFDAPFFNDPKSPNASAGYVPGLWDYEVTELFFANKQLEYVEIELEPHNHYMVYLLDGYRNPFNQGEKLQLKMNSTLTNNTWHCTVDIPLAFFPPNVHSFNAYAIHGSCDARLYQAMAPVDGNGVYTKPDFHLLQLYKKIDISQIIPAGYNDAVYNDPVYGDLWAGNHTPTTTAPPTPPTTSPNSAISFSVNSIHNVLVFMLLLCATLSWL